MEMDLAQLANDRFEIADALHRYAFGLDYGDADSLASALTDDCRFDFRPAGRKLEIDFPLLSGRDAILNSVLPLIGPLDTSHSVSNLQIEIVGDTATLYAYVLSQHFMPRQGSRRGSEYALLMNRYDCNLMRDRDKWRFKRITIDNAWALGNPEILNALASRLALRTKSKKTCVEGTRRPTQTRCIRRLPKRRFHQPLSELPRLPSCGVRDRLRGRNNRRANLENKSLKIG
jgi:hypothetical protein